jgi:competence protein ComEC
MPKSWLTIVFLISFLVTTVFLQWFQMAVYPIVVWIALGFPMIFLVFLMILGCLNERLRSGAVIFLLCVLVGSSLSILRVSQTTHVTNLNSVESYARGENVKLHGVIADEPDRRPMKTKYTVEVDEIIDESHVKKINGKVLITDYDAWPRHSYGDEVVIVGKLDRPTKIEDFYYDRYLSRYDVYSVIYRADIQTASSGHGSAFFSFLYDLKHQFESQLNRLYPEPHASFMAGLLTGSRRGIPEHLLEDFQSTGLTHIIAISGYNISIVISFITVALFFLPLRFRFIPAVFAIVFFTFFVGASPSVVRAAIMGVLGLFALQSGRQKHSLIAILLAGAMMIAWNPKVLWYDAGFQLSFLAVLGISYIGPFFERPLKNFPQMIREPLQMTLSAQLSAVPLIVLLFGQLSLIAPFANVLVALLIPIGMLFGFFGVVASFIYFPLGQLIAFVGFGALELIILVAETCSSLTFALVETPGIGWKMIIGYYVVLIVLISITTHTHKPSAPSSLAAA